MSEMSAAASEALSPERLRLSTPLPAARPTWAEVSLGALHDNLRCVQREVAPAALYAVVKADAYGHGLEQAAQCFERAGADGLCVALAEEGLRLRAAGLALPILVLNGAYGRDHLRVLEAGLTPVVYSLEQALAFSRARPHVELALHLKLDTGMSRLGVLPAELPALLDAFASHPNLRIDGVLTHLSSADDDPEATAVQIARFEAALELVRARGHRPRLVHAANSAAAFAFPEARYNLVRAGLALYGHAPRPSALATEAERALRPAMRVRTEVIALRELPEGTSVGYNQTFRTERASRIATVPIGYGDGLMRSASNRGHMLVRGQRCPIVGRVSMDLTTLDVTDLPACAIGDEVVVLGRQAGAEISAWELAEASGTIAYEVLTSISARVPRVYVP